MEPKENLTLKDTEQCLDNLEKVCKHADKTLITISALFIIIDIFVLIGLIVLNANIGVIIGVVLVDIIVINILMLIGNLILSSYWWKKEVLRNLKEINEK